MSAAEAIFGSSAPSCIAAAGGTAFSAGLAAGGAASSARSAAGGTAFSAGFAAASSSAVKLELTRYTAPRTISPAAITGTQSKRLFLALTVSHTWHQPNEVE